MPIHVSLELHSVYINDSMRPKIADEICMWLELPIFFSLVGDVEKKSNFLESPFPRRYHHSAEEIIEQNNGCLSRCLLYYVCRFV